MDSGEYLKRLGVTLGTPSSEKLLARLQEAHLRNIPFENLDISARVPIVLDLRRMYEKIIVRRRGGFCYELNGMFGWLLAELGFRVSMVSARVYDPAKETYGPEFDHMALIVEGESGRWLADVGFGDFSIRPLRIESGRPQDDPAGKFILEEGNGGIITVSRWTEDAQSYVPQYEFTPEPRRLEDFNEMCLYQQTSPESHFTQKRVCSVATASGRVTLSGDRLIVTSGGRRRESPVAGEEGFRAALREHFGITL